MCGKWAWAFLASLENVMISPPPPSRTIEQLFIYFLTSEVNVGLDSSVGRAPARQSGGRRFKSRSSQFFFVHPNLSKICTQSVSLVVYYMTFI